MAYDDDGSFGFKDWNELEALLQVYLASPENISVSRLRAALDALAKVAANTNAHSITVHQVDEALRSTGLRAMPHALVMGLLEAVAQHPQGAADRMTIRDLEQIVTRARQR